MPGIRTLFFAYWDGRLWLRGWGCSSPAVLVAPLPAGGGQSRLRKSLRNMARNKKSLPGKSEAIFHSFLRLRRFRIFEPKPRFELGTPSLRVKCSTAELFRPWKTRGLRSECKYPKKKYFSQQFYRKSRICCYIRIQTIDRR